MLYHKNFDISIQDDILTLSPKNQKPQQALIFLHGGGQIGPLWAQYFLDESATPQGTKIILLTAPKQYTSFYKKSTRTWYDFHFIDFSQKSCEAVQQYPQAAESAEKVCKVLEAEISEIGDSRKCFVGGFSMGGFIAALAWKKFNKPLGGLIIYSSMTGNDLPINPEQEASPVLLSHGLEDDFSPYEEIRKQNVGLENGRRRVCKVLREGLGHGVDRKIQIETRSFIEGALQKPRL